MSDDRWPWVADGGKTIRLTYDGKDFHIATPEEIAKQDAEPKKTIRVRRVDYENKTVTFDGGAVSDEEFKLQGENGEVLSVSFEGFKSALLALTCVRKHGPKGCDCRRAKKFRNTGNRHRKPQ